MDKIISNIFSEGMAIFVVVFAVVFGLGYILYTDIQNKAEKDAREDAQIVDLVKHGTPLPDARCAVRGC